MTTTTMTMGETSEQTAAFPGGVSGAPRTVLRMEGLTVMVLAVTAFAHLGGSWSLFAMLFLAPDLSFFGYLGGKRLGAIAYNAMHSYLGPALLAPFAPTIALIWAAHVGFDRALGYGLKYGTAFGHTHLGRVGKDA